MKKSAIIMSVGQYMMDIKPLSTKSFTQKYPISICRVNSDVDLPFSISLIVDKLSWYTIMGGRLYPVLPRNMQRIWIAGDLLLVPLVLPDMMM